MIHTIDAVWKDSVVRPIDDVVPPVAEGQRVRLTLETEAVSADEILQLAAQVYQGLTLRRSLFNVMTSLVTYIHDRAHLA